MRLIASKIANEKALFWQKEYESGLERAKADDLRIPDQFVTFQPPSDWNAPAWFNNPNSTWASQSDYGWW